MEKEAPESMATVNMKPEYAPSEVYSSSEPPPAYHRSQSSSVHIAKIIAVTVVVCSVILGSFLLASAYVKANASCRHLEQELEFLGEAADRIQGPLQPEALIQDGRPPHYSRQVRNNLDTTFPGRWIGRRGPTEWPARSPDLTPLDSLRDYLKQKLYETESAPILDIRQRIISIGVILTLL